MAKPRVDYEMGKYVVKDENGNRVATYVAKYEAKEHAAALANKYEREKQKKKEAKTQNSFTNGRTRAEQEIRNKMMNANGLFNPVGSKPGPKEYTVKEVQGGKVVDKFTADDDATAISKTRNKFASVMKGKEYNPLEIIRSDGNKIYF